MRTTVELPASLRQEVVNAAARRNAKGYSAIIVEALERYFQEEESGREKDVIASLRGSMSDDEYNKAVAARQDGRGEWRT